MCFFIGPIIFKLTCPLFARDSILSIRCTFTLLELIGFIKFGSRVDLFFPIGTKINTQLEEKVTGGQSVIASY